MCVRAELQLTSSADVLKRDEHWQRERWGKKKRYAEKEEKKRLPIAGKRKFLFFYL
jgi:hypothetical protein